MRDSEPDQTRALSSAWAQRIAVEQIQWIIKEVCQLSHIPPPVGSFPYDEMIEPGNIGHEYPWSGRQPDGD